MACARRAAVRRTLADAVRAGRARRWIGFVAILQSVLLLLPLPVLPLIPSLALIVLSLGLVAKDGRAVAIGLVLCAAATAAFVAALVLGAAALGLA